MKVCHYLPGDMGIGGGGYPKIVTNGTKYFLLVRITSVKLGASYTLYLWECKFNPLLAFGLSTARNFNENDNPPEATGVFFQHSATEKQWHGLSAVGTLTGTG